MICRGAPSLVLAAFVHAANKSWYVGAIANKRERRASPRITNARIDLIDKVVAGVSRRSQYTRPNVPFVSFFFFLSFVFFSFILLVSACFYPGHPCGTVNVSQGLLATQTVTKWNGRKNEWKTIKEGPRTVGGESRAQVVEEGTGEEEKTEGRPPTGPIKSITFFSLVFRFSVQFFFFRRFSSRIRASLRSSPLIRSFHENFTRGRLFAFVGVYSRLFSYLYPLPALAENRFARYLLPSCPL